MVCYPRLIPLSLPAFSIPSSVPRPGRQTELMNPPANAEIHVLGVGEASASEESSAYENDTIDSDGIR